MYMLWVRGSFILNLNSLSHRVLHILALHGLSESPSEIVWREGSQRIRTYGLHGGSGGGGEGITTTTTTRKSQKPSKDSAH